MQPAPPKTLEAIAGLLLPPACREDILGDLHERYTSPGQYVVEIASTVPHAILSRIRRTADLEVLLMEALVLYSSFLAAAWYLDPRFLMTNWQLFRLSIPAAVALGALMLADAYAIPGKRPTLQPIREAALSIAFAFLSQVPLLAVSRGLAVSRWIMLSGGGISLLLISTVRMLFPQPAERSRGVTANGPLILRTLKGEPMNLSAKLFMICAALICIAVAGWTAFQNQHRPAKVNYSAFLQQVESGKVASVIIGPANSGASQLTGTLKDGATERTVLPSEYSDALAAMQDKLVDIEIRESSSLLMNSVPFLLLLGIWFFMMMRQLQNRPRTRS